MIVYPCLLLQSLEPPGGGLSTGRNKVGTVERSLKFLRLISDWKISKNDSGKKHQVNGTALGRVPWGNMGWQKWRMTTSDIRLLQSSLNEPHFNKVTFVFCQGQLCFIWDQSPNSKIFWIIPILSITFLSRLEMYVSSQWNSSTPYDTVSFGIYL